MIDLLIIQPTPFCNINCSYCYLADRDNKNKITREIIELIARRVIESKLYAKEITVVWHAGEPMVLNVKYFSELIQILNKNFLAANIDVVHSIQTNGTLITQDWCDLINKYKIKIGISLDGPEFINDVNRKTRNGKSTFTLVMKGINLLRENKIKYHAIAVISELSLQYPDEIFDFFYENDFFQLGLNIEELEGINLTSSLFTSNFYTQVETFYKKLFERYICSDNKMIIREFENGFNAVLSDPTFIDIRKREMHSHQNEPFGIITIDYLGNFSTFSPELIGQKNELYNNFILGNICDSSFKKPKQANVFKSITREINAGVKKCKKECQFFYVCGGGAPSNKYYENNSFNSTETNYCRYTIQIPTLIALSYLEEKVIN
jgi:uncharacterized protein